MPAPPQWTQDPQERLDYPIEYEEMLDGDVIVESEWDATALGRVTGSAALTLENDSYTETLTVVWVSGGTLNELYEVTNHIVTASGREHDRSIRIYVTEK